ncbi:hypothetical protein QQF64_002644 [Cirrhinus molitorella]|uniref:Uncharacterized protein n=1 Tax=Cirrhinus molitorella TaxID=172907 RepID=A0ABR3MQR7_9TELE
MLPVCDLDRNAVKNFHEDFEREQSCEKTRKQKVVLNQSILGHWGHETALLSFFLQHSHPDSNATELIRV